MFVPSYHITMSLLCCWPIVLLGCDLDFPYPASPHTSAMSRVLCAFGPLAISIKIEGQRSVKAEPFYTEHPLHCQDFERKIYSTRFRRFKSS